MGEKYPTRETAPSLSATVLMEELIVKSSFTFDADEAFATAV